MEIAILGFIRGDLLLWLFIAFLWVLDDFRRYEKGSFLLLMLLGTGNMYARQQTHGENEEGVRTVFGRTVFASKSLSFEPNMNLATPEKYTLGPGDEVIITVWGASENTIRQTISPEGNIMVSNIGPVYLNGLSVKEATLFLQQQFSKIYGGIPDKEFSLKLTLGQIRSIQINVMGEVAVPGTYTLSSFASVFHALYRAGGVSAIGNALYNWCGRGRKWLIWICTITS